MAALEQLVLMPEARARRALGERVAHVHVLAPFGAFVGAGALRVLRANERDDGRVALTCGYDAYERRDD